MGWSTKRCYEFGRKNRREVFEDNFLYPSDPYGPYPCNVSGGKLQLNG
jgi:hypothetical protein